MKTELFINAMRAKLELPCEVTLLAKGLDGFDYSPETTVEEAADKIVELFLESE